MAIKVVGKFMRSFTDKKTGERIVYARVHAEMSKEDMAKCEHSAGVCFEEIKCPLDLYEHVEVGNSYSVVYNRYGGVSDFLLVQGGEK